MSGTKSFPIALSLGVLGRPDRPVGVASVRMNADLSPTEPSHTRGDMFSYCALSHGVTGPTLDSVRGLEVHPFTTVWGFRATVWFNQMSHSVVL